MDHRIVGIAFAVIMATHLFQSVCLPAETLAPRPLIAPGSLGRDVNPFIGTGGVPYLCGNNFPGATVPFGMIRLSPDTVSGFGHRATNTSGYYYRDPKIIGFSHTRLAGTGATDGGNILVIPCFADTAKRQRRGMNADFSHEHETAFPGYYGVNLPKLGITAELTASRRVGVHRYTFSETSQTHAPHLLVYATSALGKGTCKFGDVRVIPEAGEFEGTVQTFGTFSKRYGGLKIHFVGRFNQPIQEFATWTGDSESTGVATASGDDLSVDFGFHPESPATTVELKLGISYVSIENARANLEQEAGGATFDQILARAISEWEEKLSRIQISGGSDEQRTIFRTALYHSLQMPTLFNDVNGDYSGFDGRTHHADGFEYYTDMSLWDTFRTVHPLFNLICRREQRDMVVSLLKMGEQGGYLPRWPSGVGYTNSMFGTPADIVIAESYLKGIRDFDINAAYALMRKGALEHVPAGSRFSGRVGIDHYLKHGYCPADLMKKSVSSTIEYCYADQAIAGLAEVLGRHEDALLFREHGRYYKNLWNPQTQFFQPRDSQRQFVAEFRPELLTYLDFTGKLTEAYVEGSAWQWRWGVASDADELVSLFETREAFVEQLSQFFERAPAGVGVNPNAYYWQGNQPDLFAAYLFNSAGRPDLTQKWARWILKSKYGDRENGLDGNDDGGTLSAWYVFSSLGLSPVAGTDRYEIGSPLWPRAEIQIQNNRLTILAEGTSEKHVFVQRVWLNDKLLDHHTIRHAVIERGGTLRFEMGEAPVFSK